MDPSLRKRYANRLFPKEAEKMLLGWNYKRSAKQWPSHLKKQCMEELQKYQIVAMTLHKLGELANNVRTQRKSNHQPLNPDVVVVEEAGQILEASMCNAIAVIPEHARLIQIGDHMQLPATCR